MGLTETKRSIHSCCQNCRICQQRGGNDPQAQRTDGASKRDSAHIHARTHAHTFRGLLVPTLGAEGPDVVFFSEHKGISALTPASSKWQKSGVGFASGNGRTESPEWPEGGQVSSVRGTRVAQACVPSPEGLQIGSKGRQDQVGKPWVPPRTAWPEHLGALLPRLFLRTCNGRWACPMERVSATLPGGL